MGSEGLWRKRVGVDVFLLMVIEGNVVEVEAS